MNKPDVHLSIKINYKKKTKDFPGGPLVKNLPANVGDIHLTSGPGRFHILRSNETCVPQLLRHPGACALQQEKPKPRK